MTTMETSAQPGSPGAKSPVDWRGMAIGALAGAVGGALASRLAGSSSGAGALIGGSFGLAAAAALRGRAASAGEGLIWGVGGGFLLWIVLPSARAVFHHAPHSADEMLGNLRLRIPGLLACVLGIGAPVGVALGVQGGLRQSPRKFHWGRAIVAGGTAGLLAALIFSRWMYEGDFFPLISGLGSMGTRSRMVLLQFAVASLMGCAFGAVFQNDVRNLGSSMGWGMAYAMFWWFLGSMTLFPLAAGNRPDWSAANASVQFGPLVGHIFFGLILGVVYSGVNTVWTRLFVDADPLNRRRAGPGIRLVLSVGWGSAAGFCGGLIALPIMIQTGVIAKLAGLDSGVPLAVAIFAHLAVSTLIGASYGVLFRGEGSDVVSGSLWGFMVGLTAWYAGPLTLMPLIRTGECDWRPEAAAALLPSLVGHLLFGAATANIFLAFERRALRRRSLDGQPTAPADAIEGQRVRPTAALCVFAVGIGVLLPVLLS